MTDEYSNGTQQQTDRSCPTTHASQPSQQRPMGDVDPEPAQIALSKPTNAATANGTADAAELNEAVVQLAAALRAADRAHGAYVAELRLGDVEPSDDWPTWYAEYLLGLR